MESRLETHVPVEGVFYRGWSEAADREIAGADPLASRRGLATFTDSPDVAAAYALPSGVVGCYRLRMERALVLDPEDKFIEIGDLLDAFAIDHDRQALEMIARLLRDTRESWYAEGEPWEGLGGPIDADAIADLGLSEAGRLVYSDSYLVIDHPVFRRLLERSGHDGVVAMGAFTNPWGLPAGRAAAEARGSFCEASASVREYRVLAREQVELIDLPPIEAFVARLRQSPVTETAPAP